MDEKPMTCEEARETIEELSPRFLVALDDKAPVMVHIRECDACRECYERSLAFDRVLDGWEVPSPKANIHARVMAAVAQLERDRKDGGHAPRFIKWLVTSIGYRFQVPAAAAFAVVVLLLVSIGSNIAQMRSGEGVEGRATVADTEASSPAATTVRHVEEAILRTPPPESNGETAVKETYGGNDPYGLESGAAPPVLIVILGAPPMGFDPAPFRSAQFKSVQTQTQKENRL
jgi:hypothetical protein